MAIAEARIIDPFALLDSGGTIALGADAGGTERIERTLTGLWSRAMHGESDCQSVYRLSLSNLMVLGQAGDEPALDAMASSIASQHPSRVLLALADPGARELTATLSASCRKNPTGSGVICWEKITLRFPPDEEERLGSALRALMIGRIATIVVFALPTDRHRALLRRIRRWADLLVTQSDELGAVPDLLFWDSNGNRKARCHWLDRRWESTNDVRTGWAARLREPDAASLLEQADSIVCAGPDATTIRLLLGWIHTRMSWNVISSPDSGVVRIRRHDGSRCRLRFEIADTFSLTLSATDSPPLVIDATDTGPTAVGAWDDPVWVDRMLGAIHEDAPAEVFLTAAGAAYRLSEAAAGHLRLPRLTVSPDSDALAARAAARFAELAEEAVAAHGVFRVALAGGRTPEAMYRELAQPEYRARIPWDKIDWFWGDERWVPHHHSDSNYLMARQALLDHVPVDQSRVHSIPTDRNSPAEAAEDYELVIRQLWGERVWHTPAFDLILLGIGEDGHTASWFLGLELDSSDYRFAWGGYVPAIDANRVTLTPRLINGARHVLLLAEGSRKAGIVAQTLYPNWEHRHPAARIEPREGYLEWYLDRDAAAGVDERDFAGGRWTR